jgi:hypothetical protein
MKRYLGNAFSLNMVEGDVKVSVQKVDAETVINAINKTVVECVIGHTDTARVVGSILGVDIEPNRVTVKLNPGDILYVAQYVGPRLLEGATTLPSGARIEFKRVTVEGDLKPYELPFLPDSLHGQILKQATDIAEKFGATTNAMQDDHGNFIVTMNGRSFVGRLWED